MDFEKPSTNSGSDRVDFEKPSTNSGSNRVDFEKPSTNSQQQPREFRETEHKIAGRRKLWQIIRFDLLTPHLPQGDRLYRQRRADRADWLEGARVGGDGGQGPGQAQPPS